jgi:hypothetical protein
VRQCSRNPRGIKTRTNPNKIMAKAKKTVKKVAKKKTAAKKKK